MVRSSMFFVVPLLTKSLACRNANIKCCKVLRKTRIQMNGTNIFSNQQRENTIIRKQYLSVDSSSSPGHLSQNMYETISHETLESLTEFCESLEDLEKCPKEFDATYSNGVLTLSFGAHGTYVINKQSPNRQIWLSSPFSGPKRYDFENGRWVYKHDGISLHSLLQKELSNIFDEEISMEHCAYS
ncbi:FXN [Acanthosepion pharaonis]|uniref:ferroxidase n=1 Tax=Acanthosepion pharaonis TaxID=158019 RepID=A0A812DJB9_ACAPH|nr:FXN [Sepia pharaonis]